MEKITEKVLLEKASPKTSELEQIKTLNLSKLGLKHKDLPVKLLSRLVSLESLNLSGNRLQEFPRDLKLPLLRFLDMSDNQIEDVTTLEALSGVEELKMENNLYVTVSDNHKLMVLLPKLRLYNGKDITSSANHLRFVYTEHLKTRIVAVWEKSFSLSQPITKEKTSSVEKSFISMARQQVKFGPSSVSDFTKWRVEILAKEYLNSLTEPKKESKVAEMKESSDVLTPTKRKLTAAEESQSPVTLMPRKKPRTDLPANDSPRKTGLRPLTPAETNPVRSSPRKTGQPPSAPARRETPRKSSAVSRQKEGVAQVKQGGGVGAVKQLHVGKNASKTKPVHLKPLHVLQCHSKKDSAEDFSTQLWACAFQPLHGSTGGSRLVATCGGESVCVIDCEVGMVMKKYKVPGEEFFSLAWSTVLMSTGNKSAAAQPCSILAVGGKRGVVKLIHPRNNVAYGEFRASRKALSVLRFNHRQGNFLFTGSYDKKIVMWDIGGVDGQYNYKVVQLLVLEGSATPLHLCLPLSAPGSHLLTACDDGLHCYNTQLGSNTKRSKEMEITFPIYKKENKERDYHTVDGLSFLTDDIVASKNFMHNCIYLWSWSATRAQKPDRKSLEVSAVVLAELQWTSTEIPYLSLNTCPGRGYIVCGDDKGRLWTYHVTDLQKSNFQAGKPIQPTEVLEWPAPVSRGHGQVEGPSINSVAMDPELGFLVALSDKNMVIVWKKDESS
ncbi:leucine-rich repeat and WD repeat-containing protein 1 isoform X1 [Nelusetta ayraudi]|uniref:leucine-rich repeat and WD repeat-containing protein 1 isoform X1 n=1 Tax=Nelusetta ayraudi TaxID=303726 RepID=UPI003F6E4F39